MAGTRITVTDDGGPVAGRLGVNCSPGPQNGERFATITIGALELRLEGVEEIAAERAQAIAAEFHRLALELLRSTITPARPGVDLAGAASAILSAADRLEAGALRITPAPSTMPTIFDCGCSRLKVAAGLCSIYDEKGTERSA